MQDLQKISMEALNNLGVLAKKTLRQKYFDWYCEYVHRGNWVPAPHLKVVCGALQEIIEGKEKRLIITTPPRHGKSMAVTETFPSFFMGQNPDKEVIVSSYSSELAKKFGRKNKRKILEFGQELFGVNLSKEKSSQSEYDLEGHSGGAIFVGIGGAITGRGADLLIIDDPIKNRQEAESPTYRERVWSEYKSTLYTRLHPGAAVIVIITRWHEDDLVGRLLNPEFCEPEDWRIINFPAICEEENDILGREIGDPLWPEHGYDIDWCELTKKAVGARDWASLYQQRPAPAEGTIFKRDWWQRYKELPGSFDQIIQSWDCTFKDKKNSDFVVGQVWGKKGANKYLIDQVRAKLSFTETVAAIRGISYKYPKSVKKLIEDTANGPAIIDALNDQISGLIPLTPKGSKEARAYAVTPAIEAGNVFVPDPSICPWIHDFVEECASFPNGKNDDQVDAMAQALNHWNNNWIDIVKLSKAVKQVSDSDKYTFIHRGGLGY